MTHDFLQANKWTLTLSGEVIAFQSQSDIELYPTHISTWEYISEGVEVWICQQNPFIGISSILSLDF